MNCRLRRQENREKLESQVRFFDLPYISAVREPGYFD